MPPNRAAQTAFGPMVLVAVEQSEPRDRRLVDDDLAVQFLPQPIRWLINSAPSNLLRRLAIAVMEHEGPGLLESAVPGSRLVFTYVRSDFIDGINLYGAETLYRRFVQRQRLWHFGLPPQDVAAFLAGHGWRLSEQAGPDVILHRYIEPTGRHLTASPIEWTAYAEKT